jgi:hypothetical protein
MGKLRTTRSDLNRERVPPPPETRVGNIPNIFVPRDQNATTGANGREIKIIKIQAKHIDQQRSIHSIKLRLLQTKQRSFLGLG